MSNATPTPALIQPHQEDESESVGQQITNRALAFMRNGLKGEAAWRIATNEVLTDSETTPHPRWEEPEDRASAALSPLGEVEYVEDFVKPARLIVVAAEEGTGKTMAFPGELGIRLAVAGGLFAQTWPILVNGPVLTVSEMPADEDYHREAMILNALGKTRNDLRGKYFRQSLATAAGGDPILDVPGWRDHLIAWALEKQAIALFIDTATMATDADPWGGEMRTVIRNLRAIQDACPRLAIFPIVHLKKPTGRSDTAKRGLSAVMGEWGRPSDVVVLLQNDGRDHVVMSTHKRVRNQRRLKLTKSNGLLVDPLDLYETGTTQKISNEGVLAAIQDHPGITKAMLAAAIEVTGPTAGKYMKALAAEGLVRLEEVGPRKALHAYPVDTEPTTLFPEDD